MKLFFQLFMLLGIPCLPTTSSLAQNNDAKAQQLATAVWQASGGEKWPAVKEIFFTFDVEKNNQPVLLAEHDWKVDAGTDRVRWNGKDVTVNLVSPAQDENNQAAYRRWVNDSYWLLAPLKIRDPGVKIQYEGSKDVQGTKREVLHLSFQQVGLTPNDQYLLYIDPQTNLVTAWDYIPKPDTTVNMSWENYQKAGGLLLATEHKLPEASIRILNLKVVARK